MRILAIRGKNLASLCGEFAIDLNKPPLEQAGLFAITGHTGAGKSTLLDAMCLALFDKIPRLLGSANVKIGRSDEDEKQRVSSSDVGSIITRGSARAYAEVDFIGVDRLSYQAHWEIKRARNKVSGRLQKQTLTLKKLPTYEVIGQNKSDTLEAISERIGLTFEQFRRSVLLAQGDFAAFLKARSDERSALLERITGTEIYSQLSIAAYRHFQVEEQKLNRIQDKLSYDIPLKNNERQDLQIAIEELSDELEAVQKSIDNNKELMQWYETKKQLQQEQKIIRQSLKKLNIKKVQKAPLKKELQQVISVQTLRSVLQTQEEFGISLYQLQEQIKQANSEIELANENEIKLKQSIKLIQENLTETETQYEKIKPNLFLARELDTKINLTHKEYLGQEKKVNTLIDALKQLNSKKININTLINKQQSLEQSIIDLNNQLNKLQRKREKFSLGALNQQIEDSEQRLQKLQKALSLERSYQEKQEFLEICKIDQEKLAAAIDEIIHNITAKNKQYLGSISALDEAKRALIMMQESVTQGAQSLRALLNNKQACPVCGSLEHPWAGQDSVLSLQYQQQKGRVTELEQTTQSLLIELNTYQQQKKHAETEKLQQKKRILELTNELEKWDDQWREIRADCEFLVCLGNKDNEKYLLPEIQALKTEAEQYKEQVKKTIALQNSIDHCHKEKDRLQNQEKEQNSNIIEQQVLINDINNFDQQLQINTEELGKRSTEIKDLQQERKQLLVKSNSGLIIKDGSVLSKENESNTDVATIDAFYVDAIAKLVRQYESEKSTQVKIKQLQIKNNQRCLYLQEQIDGLHLQHRDSETWLANELKSRSIDMKQLQQLLSKDEAWIKMQQDDFTALNNDLITAETLLKERNLKLQQHEEELKRFSNEQVTISEDVLSEQVQQQSHYLHSVQNNRQEKLIELKQDDIKKQRMANYRVELDAQNERYSLWGSLNELIGSANGNKFRVFAQSLTLESLLAHANEHLEDFARRYQLQRVPDTDLDLQIVDRDMADEVRSVQSLSGGESFLVSLALALGLASLSSSRTQVESLFIDEGFGTLDQETLDIAIASLDTLQGLGRKVGIISHVPILVERIGTRVVVEKMGGGQSRVIVET